MKPIQSGLGKISIGAGNQTLSHSIKNSAAQENALDRWQDRQSVSLRLFLGRILMKNNLFEGGRRDASANPSECEDGKTAVKKGFFSECLDGVQLPIQKCPDGLQFSQQDQTCMPGYLL